MGDLARRDAKGRYFIEGRKRDMIISAGVNVYPAEVEGVLEANPEVAEVAVVGVEDPEWGEGSCVREALRVVGRVFVEHLRASPFELDLRLGH